MSIKKVEYQDLLSEVVTLIEKTKYQVVSYANSSLTILFWHIGERILTQNLQNDRGEYGKQIITNVSNHLEQKYGRNFTEKNLRRMMQFCIEFPDFLIVVPLSLRNFGAPRGVRFFN